LGLISRMLFVSLILVQDNNIGELNDGETTSASHDGIVQMGGDTSTSENTSTGITKENNPTSNNSVGTQVIHDTILDRTPTPSKAANEGVCRRGHNEQDLLSENRKYCVENERLYGLSCAECRKIIGEDIVPRGDEKVLYCKDADGREGRPCCPINFLVCPKCVPKRFFTADTRTRRGGPRR
jgi:hypothetical protein